jgi:hypothetical protein
MMDSDQGNPLTPVEGQRGEPLVLRRKVSYPTFQLFATVANSKTQPEVAFRIAILETMSWLRKRFRAHEIPSEMLLPEASDYADLKDGMLASFRLDEGYVVEVSYLEGQGVWALHLSEPDLGPDPERTDQPRKPVPGRMFETNIAFRLHNSEVQCAFKTICSEPSDADAVCEVFRLAVVKALVRNPLIGLQQSLPVIETALRIDTGRDLIRLRDALKDERRQLPVLIFSRKSGNPKQSGKVNASNRFLEQLMDPLASLTARARIDGLMPETAKLDTSFAIDDPDALARHLVGFAHVVILPPGDAIDFVKKLGSRQTPQSGDALVVFPVSSGQAPQRLPYEDQAAGRQALQFSLMNNLSNYPKGRQISFGDVKFLLDARILEHKLRASLSTDAAEVLAGKEAEIAAIQERYASERLEMQSKIYHQQRKLNQSRGLEERHAKRMSAEKAKLTEANGLLSAAKEALADKQLELNRVRQDLAALSDCEAFIRWVDHDHADRLHLTPRARQMLKKANFTEMLLLYDTLNLLAFQYRDMIMYSDKDPTLRHVYERERLRLNLDWAGLETPSLYDGMTGHFRGGGHTEQKMLRVYFNWDDASKKVVIGGVPTHWPDGSK